MTAHRDLKRIIRKRQAKIGESYTAARGHVMCERVALLGPPADAAATTEPGRADAVVLKVNRQSARVQILGEASQVTFRSGDAWEVVPGHLVTLVIEKRWTWRDDAYASGQIENPRIDVERLGLAPLPLRGGQREDLRAAYEPCRDPDPYAPLWRQLTAERRAWFEMDPIAWGAVPGLAADEDPTCDAMELAHAGDREGARELLMQLLCTDLRCIDSPRTPRQPRVRPRSRACPRPLRDRDADWRALAAAGLQRRAGLGSHLQPAVSALPARLRTLPLAARSARRGAADIRADPLAQSERQPGRAVLPGRRPPRPKLGGGAAARGGGGRGGAPESGLTED